MRSHTRPSLRLEPLGHPHIRTSVSGFPAHHILRFQVFPSPTDCMLQSSTCFPICSFSTTMSCILVHMLSLTTTSIGSRIQVLLLTINMLL